MHPVQLLCKNRIPLYLFFTVIILLFSTQFMDSPEAVFAQVKSTYALSSSYDMRVMIDDFLVNHDTTIGLADQFSPDIAKDLAGNFVIVWTDTRYGNSDIYAQRFSSTGVPLGTNLRVNDDIGIAEQKEPAIAMNGSDDFVITWEDYRNMGCGIFAQRYNSTGVPIGNNFKVNDDGNCFPLWSSPAIATDDSGNFVVTWIDSRNGSWDIFAQRYNSKGIPNGLNIKVNNDSIGTPFSPDIATDEHGNFVITWTNELNDMRDIYAQKYNSSGNQMGSAFRVNDATGLVLRRYVSIAMNRSGSFIICWEDFRNGDGDIFAQRYDSMAVQLGANFKVNDDIGTAYQDTPDAIMGDSNNLVITWIDQRNGIFRADVYAQRYNQLGMRMGVNFKVNADSEYFTIMTPAIAMDNFSNFVITWSHYPNWDLGPRDIYAQIYSFTAASLGTNFKVNDDTGSALQYSPVIAVDGTGNFVITWQDYRDGLYDPFYLRWSNSDIYAQRCNFTGTLLDSNFRVNDDVGPTNQMSPAIAINGSGNFVITWEDWRNSYYSYPATLYNSDIYAQRYDSIGTPIGSNFKVNDDTGITNQNNPTISIDASGNFVIAWDDYRNGWHDEYGIWYNSDIHAQIYDSTGIPKGANFKVNTDFGYSYQLSPDIAVVSRGNFVITWMDLRRGSWDIYAQKYNLTGTPIGSNLRINYPSAGSMYPTIATNGSGDFVITWIDYRNNIIYPDVYAQRYDSSLAPLGSNIKVNDDVGTAWQQYPDIAMDSAGNFLITWVDNRTGFYNYDIYAQRYNSSGNPVGSNYLVPNPQYASFAQINPTVVANNSNIYFAWQDNRRAKGWDIYGKVVDWNWTDVKEEQIVGLPKSFELSQNYPNPFNPFTTILFSLKAQGSTLKGPIHATLTIYNILGQKVKTLLDEEKLPGKYKITWDGKDDSGKDVASGIYFYQLKTKDYTATKKMVLLR